MLSHDAQNGTLLDLLGEVELSREAAEADVRVAVDRVRLKTEQKQIERRDALSSAAQELRAQSESLADRPEKTLVHFFGGKLANENLLRNVLSLTKDIQNASRDGMDVPMAIQFNRFVPDGTSAGGFAGGDFKPHVALILMRHSDAETPFASTSSQMTNISSGPNQATHRLELSIVGVCHVFELEPGDLSFSKEESPFILSASQYTPGQADSQKFLGVPEGEEDTILEEYQAISQRAHVGWDKLNDWLLQHFKDKPSGLSAISDFLNACGYRVELPNTATTLGKRLQEFIAVSEQLQELRIRLELI